MRLSAYFDAYEMCDFALGELKDDKAKSPIYEYKAELYYLLYQHSNLSHHPYLKQAISYSQEAIAGNPYDLIVNWNYFDTLLEARKIEHLRDIYDLMMRRFWKKFVTLVDDKQSNFDDPKIKDLLQNESLRVIEENFNCTWIKTEFYSWYNTKFIY